ncbi:MAG: hypothetical protein PVI03_04025 [Candidatus Thorarchaeota archaeon]
MKNKYGYQVGDLFRVLPNSSTTEWFSVGSIIKLKKDDGTSCPWFELVQGQSYGDYDIWAFAYEDLEEVSIQDEVIKVGDILQDDSVGRVIIVTEVRDLEEGFISGVVLEQGAGAFPKGYVSNLWKIKYHAPFTGTLTFGED